MQLAELPIPDPGPGQVLIRVEAIGVNFIEIYFRKGTYKATLPTGTGKRGRGHGGRTGPGRDWVSSPAMRWLLAECWAAMRSTRWCPLRKLVKVPHALTPEQAAAAMLQGMTAHYLATSTYPLKPGDTVLVHAGAGGVGLLLTQIAVAHRRTRDHDGLDEREGGTFARGWRC